MVDPKWNVWYWGSKWNLHTVCRGAVGCEWGTTSVYFEITHVCFIPSRLPIPTSRFFYFVGNIIWRTHSKSSKKSCWFKIWMGVVRQILIKLWTSSIRCFLKLPVWCPLVNNVCKHDDWSVHLTSPHLPGSVWYWGLKAHWSYLRYVAFQMHIFFHLYRLYSWKNICIWNAMELL